MGELIPIGIHKPQEGGTTIINENGVDYGDEIEALKNAQGIKTAPTGKIFVDWTGVGYEYEVTYPLYYINGQAFPAGSTKIPLDGSHETLDRIDTFGLNANGVFVNKGTPAAEPLAPTVDEANEIYITTRDVKANTTEPEQDTIPVSNIDVYKENQEWTGSVVSGGTTNFNNTSKTFEGAKSIRVSGSFQLKDTSNTHNRNSFGALRLKVMSSSQSYIAFSFQFLMNNTVISSTETVTAGIDYPNWKNPATYETVLVDFEKFSFTADEFNTILIMPIKGAKFTGSTFIDNISLVANSVNVVTSTGNSTIDTSEFVSKHSFHFSPFDLSGVVVDLDVSTRSGSAYAIQGTVTELHSLHNSNLIPKFFYGQDFYIKNDQATPFVIKNKSGVIAQERFIFSFPNDEDITIQPKEIFHFKNMMTEYNGGTLEFVGKITPIATDTVSGAVKIDTPTDDPVVYTRETTDNLLKAKVNAILEIKPITGITYTLTAYDTANLVELIYDDTLPMTVTIPNDATLNLPVGSIFYTVATNTGALTIAGGAGVTFQTAVGLTAGQNEVRKYVKKAANVWGIEGGAGVVVSTAKTPYTVFINTVSGNDSTGVIEDASKPFKTDTAAYAALPTDNGKTWSFVFIDVGVTRTISQVFTRPIQIKCYTVGGTFNFSSINGTISVYNIYYDIPYCDLLHSGFAATISTTEPIFINCREFKPQSTNSSGSSICFLQGDSSSNQLIKCKKITQRNFSSGSVILRGGVIECNVFDTTSTLIDRYNVILKIESLVLNGQTCALYGNGSVTDNYAFPFKKMTGSGIFRTDNLDVFDVTNLYVTGITVELSPSTWLTGIKGSRFTSAIKLAYGTIYIRNFEGRVTASSGVSGHVPTTMRIINSRIKCASALIYYRNNTADYSTDDLLFENVVIEQDTPSAIVSVISSTSNNPTFYKNGYLLTNATTIGTGVTLSTNPLTSM